MPSWLSDHLPFLRSRRSRSRDGAAISALPRIDFVPGFPSRPFSGLGIPGEDTNATATGAPHPSVPRNPIDHQNSTDRLPPNAIRMPEAHGPAVQQPNFLASSSNHNIILRQPSDYYSPLPQHQNPAMFNQAQNFTVMGGTFIAGNVTHNDLSSNQFMEKLLEKTIPGAEFDSSARDPPPRCHPGTRLAILDRCLYFIHNCDGTRKLRWVVGAAGVGKSALLQSVVESPKLVVSCHASVFFSINGRDDGTKAVVTITYQLAAKSKPYRQLIETKIIDDPSLLQSSMTKQFLKLIVEPFIHNPQLISANRVLVVIDGLDECKNPRTQLELLRLISDLCIEHPSSPLVWLIASRPEQHITSFFSQTDIAPAHEKEEIIIESDEAREDVELYLRAKLKKIKEASDSVSSRWPEEQDVWRLANAAGGLFAYAQTVVRYIEDATVGSPASQLSEVLNVIDNHPMTDLPQEDHPMTFLDALYTRILSKVPSRVMMNTRKLLLAMVLDWSMVVPATFVVLCNWLGMTPDDVYAAINHLRAVLRVPRRCDAHKENLEFFHKSFMDYISDFQRSGFSHDIEHEARQLMKQCVYRILNQAPDGIDFGDADYGSFFGSLRRGPGTGDNISISWPVDEDVDDTDNAMRLRMYNLAIGEAVAGIGCEDPDFQCEFYIHILSTRFEKDDNNVYRPGSLRDLVFAESRRQEFLTHGIIKPMLIKAVDVSTLEGHEIKLQFRRPATTATNLSDPWKSSCVHHKWEGQSGKGDDQDWRTSFSNCCSPCWNRLIHQLETCQTRSPDHTVLTLFTSVGVWGVEFRFVDPDDGISEWTYLFWVELIGGT